MKLKKLEILGFKSFADKTKLEFHAGITAVVGPNGCGKSNISDAFRWVLGEQSAKSLRGGKMPDVIFAGTTHRKPLNFAEVTITLDGIDGQLPIDYEEISITRRLHRSGESEYCINRHPVRLKDIQSLFLDSGMGKDAYSIFEQGKIDQVINLSPLERRYIFEEAAGILRFLQRKKEALRKLEQTDLNVSRVKDIHYEIEKQIIVLEQQAEKARLYKENKTELDKLEKGILFAKWESIQKRLSEASNKGKDIGAKISAINTQVEVFLVEFIEAKQTLAAAEKAFRVRSEEVYQARSAKEIKSKEQQSNQERLKELSVKEKRWQHELEAMIERRKQREIERRSTQKTQKELEKRLADIESTLRGQREKVSTLDTELNTLRRQQQFKQQEILKHLQVENQCESDLKQIQLRIENGQERHGQLQERIERLDATERELLTQVKEKKDQMDGLTHRIDGQKDVFISMEKKLHDLMDEISRTEEQLDTIHLEMVETKARYKVLHRLRTDMEGFSSSSKRLLQEAAEEGSPFFNKIKGLYEYIIPKKGEETAVAVALKAYAQTLVVETEDDFLKVISFAKKNDLKEFSILCVETVSKVALQIDTSYSGTELSPLVMSVIENTLADHFLKTAYLAKSAEEAFKVVQKGGGIEILTTEGMLIDRRSVVFYATQGENNVFMREAEIKSIEKKLVDCEKEKQQVELGLQAIQQRKNLLQTERVELDKTIRRDEMKLVEVNFALQKFKGDFDKARAEQSLLKAELQNILKTMEDHTIALNDIGQRLALAKAKVSEAKKQGEVHHEQLEEQSSVLQLELSRLQEIETRYQQITDENRKQLHALHVLEVKDVESEQQERRLEEEIEIGRHQLAHIKENSSEADKVLQEVEQNLSDVMAACKELEQDVSIRKGVIEHLEAKINDKRSVQKKHESDLNQTGIQSAQFESVGLSIENELLERHHLTIARAQEECGNLGQSVDSAEKHMRALRQQIESAGDVNMTSIEECEKHKERYQFLNQQMDDLNLSKQELISIITELDGESRKIFKTTFDQICVNFKKNFNILFNGGEADLQFTETGDVLEAGIEIIAKPPGKQMRSISLLSGGEKCLTAMALLFAVFEVKPAPFCILDEIDAPLDDANVGRFVNIVKEFVDRCQFIIITHNKRTMAIADVIFGVSMEEKGVSKLLSMDFSNGNESGPARSNKHEPILI